MFDLSLQLNSSYESFTRNLSSFELSPPSARVSVRLVRNWPAEPVERRLRDMGSLVGLDIDLQLSPYYDSLDLEYSSGGNHDFFAIWLDIDRLSPESRESLLPSAVHLANKFPTKAFCVVAAEGSIEAHDLPANMSVLYFKEMSPEDQGLADRKYGHRFASPFFSTTLQRLTYASLASAVFGAYRMIAVDFDNTLYDGVLGEDGTTNVTFSQDRVRLISELRAISEKGCLLVGVSKNDSEDVDALLHFSKEYGLSRDMFFDIVASWRSKSEVISEVISEANLHASQVLFIDDNLSELEQVKAALPEVDLIFANSAQSALAILQSGHRIPSSKDENWELRISDLGQRRARLEARKMAGRELHTQLESKIAAKLGGVEEVPRAQELIVKTNQFNLSLGRSDLRTLLEKGGSFASATVSDKLGDSGTVAIIAGTREQNMFVVHEFCISCRVLGRGLESLLFASLLSSVTNLEEVDSVDVIWCQGGRNAPALDWLSGFEVPTNAKVRVNIPVGEIKNILNSEEFQYVSRFE